MSSILIQMRILTKCQNFHHTVCSLLFVSYFKILAQLAWATESSNQSDETNIASVSSMATVTTLNPVSDRGPRWKELFSASRTIILTCIILCFIFIPIVCIQLMSRRAMHLHRRSQELSRAHQHESLCDQSYSDIIKLETSSQLKNEVNNFENQVITKRSVKSFNTSIATTNNGNRIDYGLLEKRKPRFIKTGCKDSLLENPKVTTPTASISAKTNLSVQQKSSNLKFKQLQLKTKPLDSDDLEKKLTASRIASSTQTKKSNLEYQTVSKSEMDKHLKNSKTKIEQRYNVLNMEGFMSDPLDVFEFKTTSNIDPGPTKPTLSMTIGSRENI